jgi:hypothetical protein
LESYASTKGMTIEFYTAPSQPGEVHVSATMDKRQR